MTELKDDSTRVAKLQLQGYLYIGYIYFLYIYCIEWNSPMRELIGSVMVSSLLLPAFGTLSLLLYFRLPSTFLPSKGRSITTLGTIWHDFFITLFRYFIFLLYSFHCLSFPFPKGCRLEKGHIAPVLYSS